MKAYKRLLNISGEAKTHSTQEMLALRSSQPSMSRIGKVALGKCLAPLFPDSIGDYQLLGGGCEQVVYASDYQVKKVIAASITTRSSEMKGDVSHRQRLHDTAVKYLDRQLHDTTYEPIRIKGLFATAVVQRRISDFKPLANPDKEGWHQGADIKELHLLYDSIQKLYGKTKHYPDIIGEGNIVLEGDELKIIDTILVPPNYQSRRLHGRDTTIGQLIGARLSAWESHIYSKAHIPQPLNTSQ